MCHYRIYEAGRAGCSAAAKPEARPGIIPALKPEGPPDNPTFTLFMIV
jgi:hypothetical protein